MSKLGQILRTMGQAFEDRDLKQLIKEFDTDGKHLLYSIPFCGVEFVLKHFFS